MVLYVLACNEMAIGQGCPLDTGIALYIVSYHPSPSVHNRWPLDSSRH